MVLFFTAEKYQRILDHVNTDRNGSRHVLDEYRSTLVVVGRVIGGRRVGWEPRISLCTIFSGVSAWRDMIQS